MDSTPISPSLRRRFRQEWLALLLAGILLLALALWAAGRLDGSRAYAPLQDRIASLARSQADMIGTLRNKFDLLPAVLAQDEALQRALRLRDPDDLQALNRKLQALADGIGASVLYLMDVDGLTLAASNSRASDSFVGGNFQYRPYFYQAMASGQAEYFALGTSSGREGLYMARRVQDGQNRPLGVVVIKLEFGTVERSWQQHDDTVIVTDPDGIILLSNPPQWRFRTLTPLSAARRHAILDSRQFGNVLLTPLPDAASAGGTPLLHIGGAAYLHARQSIPGSSWTLHALTPAQPALRQHGTQRRLQALLAFSVTLALAALALLRNQQQRERTARQQAVQQALEQAVAARTAELRQSSQRLADEMQALEQARARTRDLREQLEQAEKLSFLGQITAGVAHEVNQPVAAIQAHADNAGIHLARGDAQAARRSLDAISSLTQRIGQLTAQLRQYARKPREQTVAVDIRAALDNALMLLEPRLRRQDAVIDLSDVADGITVLAVQVRLEQVLVNLIRNALDALQGQPAGRIRIAATRMQDTVQIAIRDNGPGIADDTRRTLFTPFTSRRSDGMGLGLAISRDIIQTLGGTLQECPSPDGAAFLITLPDGNTP